MHLEAKVEEGESLYRSVFVVEGREVPRLLPTQIHRHAEAHFGSCATSYFASFVLV
jgi:hypothetical protein